MPETETPKLPAVVYNVDYPTNVADSVFATLNYLVARRYLSKKRAERAYHECCRQASEALGITPKMTREELTDG